MPSVPDSTSFRTSSIARSAGTARTCPASPSWASSAWRVWSPGHEANSHDHDRCIRYHSRRGWRRHPSDQATQGLTVIAADTALATDAFGPNQVIKYAALAYVVAFLAYTADHFSLAEARRQHGLHDGCCDRDVRAGRRDRHRIVRAGLTARRAMAGAAPPMPGPAADAPCKEEAVAEALIRQRVEDLVKALNAKDIDGAMSPLCTQPRVLRSHFARTSGSLFQHVGMVQRAITDG